MSWYLKIEFSDGTSEIVDEAFESREDAEYEFDSWLENWNTGRETLMLAGEDYSEAEIEGGKIWED